MNYLCQNYNPDAAADVYESYVEGEDVKVTKASRLLALSTFAKSQINGMRMTRNKCCVGTHLLTMFANMQRGWGQSVFSRKLHTKKEFWSCL